MFWAALALALVIPASPGAQVRDASRRVQAQATIAAPDDPGFHYTEFVRAEITSHAARFVRDTFVGDPFNEHSPGTRINFRSDATRIEAFFRYRTNCGLDLCWQFAVDVDGVLRPSPIGSSAVGVGSTRVFRQAAPQAHDFSLILPYASDVDFLGLSLTGGSGQLLTPPPSRPLIRYAAFGDSITQGLDASTIASTYPYLVGVARGWSVINLGFASHTVRAADGVPLGMVPADVITLAIGTNDYGLAAPTPEAVFKSEFEGLLDDLRVLQPSTPVVCITPTWRSNEEVPNTEGLVLDDYRRVLREVVAERSPPDANLYLIEGRDLVPPGPTYFAEGLHPNDAGFALYAANLARFNLIRDAGFEDTGALWDSTGDAAISAAAPHGGAFALRLGPGSGTRSEVVYGITAGRSYELTVWSTATVVSDPGTIGIDFLDASDQFIDSEQLIVSAGAYQEDTLAFTAPAGTVRAEVWVHKDAGTGVYDVDDFELLLDLP